MNTFLILGAILSRALVVTAAVVTPTPIQPGFPSGCQDFAMAIPGDTCDSFAIKHHLAYFQFLAYNPQIGGPDGCPQNVAAWNWYCVSPNDGYPGVATETAPPVTVLVTATVLAPPASKTRLILPTPDFEFTPTPHASCPTNGCYRAFRQAAYGAETSQSSWCTSLLYADPPVTEPSYDNFPGIPKSPQLQCASLGPADEVLSQYCRCYTDGQMEGGPTVTLGRRLRYRGRATDLPTSVTVSQSTAT